MTTVRTLLNQHNTLYISSVRLGGEYFLNLEKIHPFDTKPCFGYNSTPCTISPQSDFDFFPFRVNTGTIFRVAVSSIRGYFEPRLQIWNSNGKLIADESCVGDRHDGCTTNVQLQPPLDDVYLLAVSDDSALTWSEYNLTIECLFGDCPPCPPIELGTVENDQMWSGSFGGGFSGEFSPGDGLVIKNMLTVGGPASNKYDLGTIYKLVDSNKKMFNLGKKWRKNRGPGHYYFRYSAATIPNSAALGKAKVKILTRIKKDGKVIDKHSKTIPIYIK